LLFNTKIDMLRKFLIANMLFISILSNAQNKKDLQQCEQIFLKTNLNLIAAQYNIDANKALVIQAKIWDNPYLSMELNANNPQSGKYFDIGQSGQKAASIQQLILLGGKRRNQIELAKSNQKLAQLSFEDLLRNLKFELRKSYYAIYFNNEKIESLNVQVNNLDTLVKAYGVQSQKGNVPIKDYLRLQSLLLDLKNEKMELVKDNIEQQSSLNILLSDSTEIQPVLAPTFFNKYISTNFITLSDIEKFAFVGRPDYTMVTQNVLASETSLKLQKSMRVPDLTLGSSWDQHGGAFNNQVNLTLGLQLPLWNKNQGNIKYAESMNSQAITNQQSEAIQLKSEIAAAFKKWVEAKNNYNQIAVTNFESYQNVYQSIVQNFKKGNISILEFTDFLESYNQMRSHYNELKKNLVLSAETLNTAANTELFK
jgi:cobalt-zinc-cadmium efflux system outer membrane protein